jgi:hypothetical protein
MKLYCPDCGQPNAYAAKKPNFCSGCGLSFATGEPTQDDPKPVQSQKISKNLEDLVEFEDDEFTNKISGLEVDIQGYTRNSVTLGQVVEEAASSPEEITKPTPQKGTRKRLTKKAKEQVMKDFKKEAGTTRGDRPDS